MKKPITKTLVIIMAVIAVSLSLLAFRPDADKGPDVMTVEIIPGDRLIHVIRNESEFETIPMQEVITINRKKTLRENGELVRKTLNRLYQEGWKIETTLSTNDIQRIFLVRR